MLEVGGNDGRIGDRATCRAAAGAASASTGAAANASTKTEDIDAAPATGEIDLTRLVVGAGRSPPEYGERFTKEASKSFCVKYEAYESSKMLNNRRQTMQRYYLTVFDL